MAKLLTKAAILKAPIPFRDVEVPEWGGTVRLRSITVRSRQLLLDAIAERQVDVDAYEADQALPVEDRKGVAKAVPHDHTILSILFAIVDKDLNPVFDLSDYEAFEELSLPTINFLWRALMDIEMRKGLTFEEQKKVPPLPGQTLPLPTSARVGAHGRRTRTDINR